jgi:hypothetical protein
MRRRRSCRPFKAAFDNKQLPDLESGNMVFMMSKSAYLYLNKRHDNDGWKWNSGFAVSARIDAVAHIWYGAMRIPYSAIDDRAPAVGNTLRINLFRSQARLSFASDRVAGTHERKLSCARALWTVEARESEALIAIVNGRKTLQ